MRLASPGQAVPFSGASDYLAEALRALALLLTIAGFVALHLLLRAGGYRGARGWTGFRATVLGQGAILAAAAASLVAGGPALGFLSVVGTLVLLVGIALLSVATRKAAILPWWSAVLVGAVLVGALAVGVLGEVGAVGVGLVWIALGYVLWSGRGAAAGVPPRVT